MKYITLTIVLFGIFNIVNSKPTNLLDNSINDNAKRNVTQSAEKNEEQTNHISEHNNGGTNAQSMTFYDDDYDSNEVQSLVKIDSKEPNKHHGIPGDYNDNYDLDDDGEIIITQKYEEYEYNYGPISGHEKVQENVDYDNLTSQEFLDKYVIVYYDANKNGTKNQTDQNNSNMSMLEQAYGWLNDKAAELWDRIKNDSNSITTHFS